MADDATSRLILDSVQKLSAEIGNLRNDIHAMQLGSVNSERDIQSLVSKVTALEEKVALQGQQLMVLSPVAETYLEFRRKLIAGISTVIFLGLCFAGYVVINLSKFPTK